MQHHLYKYFHDSYQAIIVLKTLFTISVCAVVCNLLCLKYSAHSKNKYVIVLCILCVIHLN